MHTAFYNRLCIIWFVQLEWPRHGILLNLFFTIIHALFAFVIEVYSYRYSGIRMEPVSTLCIIIGFLFMFILIGICSVRKIQLSRQAIKGSISGQFQVIKGPPNYLRVLIIFIYISLFYCPGSFYCLM